MEIKDIDVMNLMEKIDKDELINKFIFGLPVLRARIGMTQDEIGEIVGISRQTYLPLRQGRGSCHGLHIGLCFLFFILIQIQGNPLRTLIYFRRT